MDKKKYILAAIVLIVLALSIFAYSKYFSVGYSSKSAFDAVSKRTSFFVYTENIDALKNKLDSATYINTLKTSKSFDEFINYISFSDSIVKLFQGDYSAPYKKILFSTNNVGSAKIDFLNIIEFKESAPEENIKSFIKENGFTVKSYTYKSFTIYNVIGFLNGRDFSFSAYNNLFLASFNAPLVEEALNTLSLNDGKNSNAAFKELNSKSENQADLFLFIDHNNTKDLAPLFFNPIFLSDQKDKTKLADWSRYAVRFDKGNILFDGNYSSEKIGNTSLEKIISSESAGFAFSNVLPNNTAYIEALSSKNNISFQSNNNSYSFFRKWLNEEACFFILETFDENLDKRAGLILKANNLDSAKISLYLLNKEMAPVQDYDGLAIYEMNANVLSQVVQCNLVNLEKPFFVFLDDFVVFANDVNVLKNCIAKYKSKTVLKNIKSFNFDIDSTATKIVYANPQLLNASLGSIFNSEEFPKDLGKFFIAYKTTDGNVSSKGSINFEQEIRKKSNNLWDVVLDTVSDFKPQIVINGDTERKEIFVQDKRNTIYLISQSGDVLLKKEFSEPILSDVYQIDLYKANKLFYVFNTKNKIYVLKRDGSVVDGYPITLPDDASNKLLVVNYDNDRNYRFFIACQNNKVYAYEASGKPLSGWSPLGEFSKISKQINYEVFDGKDYIYFNTDAGTFYALDRKGNNRFAPVILETPFQEAFEVEPKGFVGLSNGSIFLIDLKGKTTVKILGDSTYNTFTHFLEKEAFAVANDNEIRIAKSKWTLLGKNAFNDKIVSIEKLLLNNKTWFLVNGENSISMVNELGETHRDFPMLASSKARVQSFYGSKSNLLIFIEGNKLRVFELVLPN